MNNFFKVIYATLGGFNVIFHLFSPIAIVFLWLAAFGNTGWASSLIIILGCLTTLYRGMDFVFTKEEY
jgi:hypothetical protein